MSTERLEVVVIGKDQLSAVLAKAGASAGKLSSGLEQAGSRGAKGLQAVSKSGTDLGRALDAIERNTAETVRALDRLGQSSARTGKDLDGAKRSSVELGAALGTMAAVVAKSGQAAVTQRRELDLLGRQYGDSADQIVDFTQRLEDQSNFSDEAARAAALQTASLAKNYQFTADQIDTLITRSADLAQTQGRSLGDTTERLSAALRGEAESAEVLGLVLNDSAVAAFAASQGIDNYSTGLSAAEQAQVRFQFLLQQTNDVQGAAQEAATGTAGALANLKGYALDAAAGLGDLLGPLAPIASELGEIAPALPVVGAGLGKLASAAKAAQLGTAALSLATGPVGLALAAGAAVVGLVELARAGDEHTATAKDEEAATRSLTQALLELQTAGADDTLLRGAGQTKADIQSVIDAGALLRGELDAIQKKVNEAPPTPALVNALNLTDEAVKRFTLSDAQMAQVMEDGNAIIAYQGENLENVSAAVREATRDYNMGRIGADGFARRLDQIASNLNTYGVVLRETTEGTRTQAAAFRDVTGALDAHDAGVARVIAQNILYETQAGRVTAAQQRGAEMLGALGNAYGEATRANEAATEQIAEQRQAAEELAATFQSALVPGIEGASAALLGIVGPGADALDVLDNLGRSMAKAADSRAEFVSGSLELADRLNDDAETLDRVISRFETLDALGQRTAGVESIATNLIGNPGEWATIDDLLAAGEISLQTYNRAVEAGTRIQGDNRAVQEDLNAIRAAQLPALERASEAYQEEIYHISLLEPKQQALALAYLDTANQQKLMELSSLAAAAAAGELGENGVEAANKMAQAALDADPALKQLALDAGLATKDREGKITLNTEGADTAMSELTLAVTNLDRTLRGLPEALNIEVATEVEELPDSIIPPGYDPGTVKVPVKVGEVDLSIPPGLELDPLKAPVELDLSTISQDFKDAALPWGGGADSGVTIPATIEVTGPTTAELAAVLPPSPPPIEAKVRIVGDNGQLIDVLAQSQLATDDLGNKVTTTYLTGDNGQLVSVVYDSEGRLLTIGGMAVTPQMLADNTVLVTQYDQSMGLLTILDQSTGTVLFQGDATGAINAGGQAAAARNNVDGTGATIYIRGDNSGVYASANAVSGRVLGTSYINIVGIRSGFREFAHGGTVWPEQAAHGRTIMVGEAGPELVNLPGGSQVMPHGASMSALQNSTMMRALRGFSASVADLEDVADDLADAVRDLAAAQPRETVTRAAATPTVDTEITRRYLRREDMFGGATNAAALSDYFLTLFHDPMLEGVFNGIGGEWQNDAIVAVSGEAHDAALAIGKAISEGTFTGIQQFSGLASDATLQMISDAMRVADARLGGAFTGVGATVGEDMAVGLEQSIPLVQAQANAVVGVVVAAEQEARAAWERIDAMNYRNTATGTVQQGILAEDNTYVNPDFYSRLGEDIEWGPDGRTRIVPGSMREQWNAYLRATGNYDAQHSFDWFNRAYPNGYAAAAAAPSGVYMGLTLAQRKANTGLTDAQALDLYWTAVAESGDTRNDWLAYMSPGTRASLGFAHGGTSWGNTHLVGEYGMELLKLPPGAQVTPHGASMSKLESDRGRAGRGQGGNVIFNGTVNLQPASTNVHDSIRAAALTRARYGG